MNKVFLLQNPKLGIEKLNSDRLDIRNIVKMKISYLTALFKAQNNKNKKNINIFETNQNDCEQNKFRLFFNPEELVVLP